MDLPTLFEGACLALLGVSLIGALALPCLLLTDIDRRIDHPRSRATP